MLVEISGPCGRDCGGGEDGCCGGEGFGSGCTGRELKEDSRSKEGLSFDGTRRSLWIFRRESRKMSHVEGDISELEIQL